MRIAAAVPTIGYFVLYGDAFSEMFSFTDTLGAEYLIFSASEKVRMLYYGGILIGAALLIYLWRCPAICKRVHSTHEAKDEFMRLGGASDLVFDNKFVFDDEISNYFPTYYSLIHLSNHLAAEIWRLMDADARQKTSYVSSGKFFGTIELQKISEVELLECMKRKSIGEAGSKVDPNYAEFFDALILMNYDAVKNREGIRDTAKSLYGFRYMAQAAKRSYSQLAVRCLSYAGVILAALPAFDVFLQVVLTDFGVVSLGAP